MEGKRLKSKEEEMARVSMLKSVEIISRSLVWKKL